MKSNADLQNDVYEELKWDPRINEGDIGVSVRDGIVTLSGSIPSYIEKWAAEDATRKVTGVTAVVNKIDVKLIGSSIRDDQDIAKSARDTLKWNVWVPDESIKLMVENGWVTLSGKVKYDHQRKSAETSIRHLSGVRGVTNEITVEPDLKIKDVQFQIKRALHRHAEQDANNIKVEARDGEITLSGTVHSWDEKRRAEWAAIGSAGVRKVNNNISISYV